MSGFTAGGECCGRVVFSSAVGAHIPGEVALFVWSSFLKRNGEKTSLSGA